MSDSIVLNVLLVAFPVLVLVSIVGNIVLLIRRLK